MNPCACAHVCMHAGAHVCRAWACARTSMRGRTPGQEEDREDGRGNCQRAGTLGLRDVMHCDRL